MSEDIVVKNYTLPGQNLGPNVFPIRSLNGEVSTICAGGFLRTHFLLLAVYTNAVQVELNWQLFWHSSAFRMLSNC